MEDSKQDVLVSPDANTPLSAPRKNADKITSPENMSECIGYDGHTCGRTFNKRNNAKRCAECLLVLSSPEWKKKENTKRVKAKRERDAVKAETSFARYDNKEEIPIKEIPDLLTERGITTPYVQQAILRFGQATSQVLNLTPNKSYWLRGPLDLQARILKKEPPIAPGDDYPEGELLTRKELSALYEHCALGRTICGQEMDFTGWLAARLRARTDLWYLCVNVCGKGLVDKTHREVVDFYVKKNPRYLSEILATKGEYTQEDVKRVLVKMDEHHDRLLLFPRDFYKSTINILDLVQWILVIPEITSLVITATLPLGRSFLSELSNYFIVRSTVKISNLHALFPDFTCDTGESKDTFICPARRYQQKEPSVWNSAIDAESTGFHQLLQIIDDGVSQLNSATPEARDKLWNKVILLDELLSRPEGFKTYVGTRYAGGENPDVYGRLLELNSQPEGGDLKVLVKGAWKVQPHAALKKITELTESDVDLLFPLTPDGAPAKGSFKVLRKKLLQDERTFRQQKLNEAVDDENVDQFKLNFDRDVLDRNVIQAGEVGQGTIVIGVDVAYSQNAFADLSALSVVKLRPNECGEMSMYVLKIEASRMRMSELAHSLVMLTRTYHPETILIEKSPTFDLIHSALILEGRKYQTSLPIFWAPVDTAKNAKWQRLKHLEVLLHQGRLKFVSGEYIEDLFKELQKLNEWGPGKMMRSSSTRHEDRADSLSFIQKYFCQAITPEGESDEDAKKALTLQIDEAQRKAQYERYFGGQSQPQPRQGEPEQPDNGNPLFRGQGSVLRRR
jgi:terminase large subunit-like protein